MERAKVKKRNKTAYSVKGKLGLEVMLQNNKAIMLGTQRKEAITNAMKKLMEER